MKYLLIDRETGYVTYICREPNKFELNQCFNLEVTIIDLEKKVVILGDLSVSPIKETK